MNTPKTAIVKNTVRILAVAAILMGPAAWAEAAKGRPRVRRRAGRIRRVVRPRPRPIVKRIPPRPIVLGRHVVSVAAAPAVTVVTPPVTAAKLKAEIARLKINCATLNKAREHLKKWLAGVGKGRSPAQRAKVHARLKTTSHECTLVAARIAELEKKLTPP